MSAAYKCNICYQYFDGRPDMQLKTISLIYNPEGGPDHIIDLCPRCFEAFNIWVRAERDKYGVTGLGRSKEYVREIHKV